MRVLYNLRKVLSHWANVKRIKKVYFGAGLSGCLASFRTQTSESTLALGAMRMNLSALTNSDGWVSAAAEEYKAELSIFHNVLTCSKIQRKTPFIEAAGHDITRGALSAQ